MKIIVVEDEIRIREGICKLIKKINSSYEVVGQAVNGKDGYELILDKSPDVVITDIMMPEMDGIEMLTELKKVDKMPKVIVISAYSDFSYAQAAIRLGVSEYLIKPVTINELTQSLSNLEHALSSDNNVPETLSSLNNVFLGLVNGSISADKDLEHYLINKYNMSEKPEFLEMTAYLGYYYEENVGSVKKNIEHMLASCQDVNYVILELPREMTVLTIIYGYSSQEQMERYIQEQVRKNSVAMRRVCMGMIKAEGLVNIQSCYRLINSYLDWNMVLGDDVLITFPKVTKLHSVSSVYPIEIENKMKVAMCSMDKAGTLNEVKRFEDYFFDGQLYAPKDIKEAYTRFIWTALGLSKEINDIKQAKEQLEMSAYHILGI